MKNLFFTCFCLALLACGSIEKFRYSDTPVYSTNTSWTSRQYMAELQSEDSSFEFTTQVESIDELHYAMRISIKDQPFSSYILRLRKSDLAIDGMISNHEDTLKTQVPLVQFPLYKGRKWTEKIKVQAHPRNAPQSMEASFEVLQVESHNYVQTAEIKEERKAFKIRVRLPQKSMDYYYIPPSKNFPGTNVVDLFMQLDLLNPNSPELQVENMGYVR